MIYKKHFNLIPKDPKFEILYDFHLELNYPMELTHISLQYT